MNIKEAPGFPSPHDDTVIWRYLALDKFLDLLLNTRLHFTNVSALTDQYEATLPELNVDGHRHALQQKGRTGQDLDERVEYYRWQMNSLRSGTLLNCWSAGPDESFALWRIYLANSHSGVAIRSTVGRLRQAIELGNDPYPDDVYLGQVRYSDRIAEEEPSRYSVILTKTRFYTFEHEVRLFVLEFPMSEGGISRPYRISEGRTIQVDLETLIDRIYLSPFAGAWFEPTFRKLVTTTCPPMTDRIVRSAVRDG
jgi:hypothetical protein